MIGYYGSILFETSDTKILTFNGFTMETAARYAVHEVINSKPVTEYLGPGLAKISFTVQLKGNNGVKPRDELDTWRALAENGEADILVIGTQKIGQNYWVVKSVSEAWNTIFNRGELFSASLSVTLEEYVVEV